MSNNNAGDGGAFAATQAMAPITPISDDLSEVEATVQMTSEGINAAMAEYEKKQSLSSGIEDEPTVMMTDDIVEQAKQRAAQKAALNRPQAPAPQPQQQRYTPQQQRYTPQQQRYTPQPGMMPPGMMPPGMMPPGMMPPGMMPPPPGRSLGLIIAIGLVAAAILGGIIFLFVSVLG